MVRSRRSIGQSAAQPTSSYPGASTTTSTRNNSLAGRNARPIQDTTPSVRTPRDPCIRTSKRAERPSAQPRNLPTDLADSMSQETSNQHPDSSDPTTEWFQVKDIIAERRSARNPRKKEYRVDWCPNKETGEEYPPTWVCNRSFRPVRRSRSLTTPGTRGIHQHYCTRRLAAKTISEKARARKIRPQEEPTPEQEARRQERAGRIGADRQQ